jgi:hypothetical protein|tara:strand:- start:582 stop:1355 length:774 start_codon:yes stop_codon:yes gene_type:complete
MASIWEVAKISFFVVGWWAIPLIFLWFYRKKLMKYPVECVIYEKRGENLVYNRDLAGRFNEPISCYRLKVSKDTIPVPKYDWLLQYIAKPTNIFEWILDKLVGRQGTLTLFKYGSKQYKPVDARVGGKVVKKFKEIKDENGQPVYITVYEPINVKKEMSRLDFEVIDWDDINHLTQELRAIATRRSPLKNFIEKYGQVMGLAFVTMIFIIVSYFSYKMMIEAGDKYVQASRQASGFNPPAPVDNPTPTPLEGFVPQR